MLILETERLLLRTAHEDDAPFYLALVNSPGFLAHIGDRGIRNLEAARQALVAGPIAMQAAHGHSIYMVTLRECGTPIGMAGLLKRPGLDDVDLGYAFLPAHEGKGYASEATMALLPYARDRLGLTRLVAITSPGNTRSEALLCKLGMQWERTIRLTPEDPGTRLYGMALDGR